MVDQGSCREEGGGGTGCNNARAGWTDLAVGEDGAVIAAQYVWRSVVCSVISPVSIRIMDSDVHRRSKVIRTVNDGPRHLLEDRLLPLRRVEHPVEVEGLRRLHKRARLLRCVSWGGWDGVKCGRGVDGSIDAINRCDQWMRWIDRHARHGFTVLVHYSQSVISTVWGEGTERHMKSPPDFISSSSVGGRMRATTRTLFPLPRAAGDLEPRSVDRTVEEGELALLVLLLMGSGVGSGDDGGGGGSLYVACGGGDCGGCARGFPCCGMGDRGGARGPDAALELEFHPGLPFISPVFCSVLAGAERESSFGGRDQQAESRWNVCGWARAKMGRRLWGPAPLFNNLYGLWGGSKREDQLLGRSIVT